MCGNIAELQVCVKNYRNLKAMQSELNAELASVQAEILEYLKASGETSITGTDFTVKYGRCQSTAWDGEKLKAVLGDSWSLYKKSSTYERLYVR